MINRSVRHPQPDVRVAKTLDEVLAAWRLVYDAYVATGIIDANRFGLHTTVQAARPGSLVICCDSAGELSSTLTITRDGSLGLPLDAVYDAELDALRGRGARLCEFGLFTHRLSALPLHMLKASLVHALPDASSTVVIGVHPRHAGFYSRMFGFAPLSEARPYQSLNQVPVCLLQLDRSAFARANRPDRERNHPLVTLPSPDQAYDFAPISFSGTVLAHYLDSRRGQRVSHTAISNQPKEHAPP